MHNSVTGDKKAYKYNNVINLVKISSVILIFVSVFAFFIKMNNNDIFFDIAFADNENNIEQQLNEETNKIIDDVDFDSLEVLLESSQFDYSLFQNKDIKQFLSDIVNGEADVGIDDIFKFLINVIKGHTKQIFLPLTSVFLIVLLAAVFNNLRGHKISGVSEIVYLICFAFVVIIVSTLISKLISSSTHAISVMQSQMNVLFPILIALMTTIGGVASVGAFTPIIAFLSLIVSRIFLYILFPLFTLNMILSIIGNISKNANLDKMTIFLKTLFKWILGSVCTIFLAYLSVKTVVSGGKDGLTIKATKYAIKNYIPMLGGYISEGFEVIKAGGLIVKNAVGFVGIILILSTCLTPVVMLAVTQIGLQFLSGVLGLVGDTKSSVFLHNLSGSLKMLFAVVLGVALMYFFTLYLMICSLSGVV